MIDEIKLTEKLLDELAIARAKYCESEEDSFYCGVCSALETTIDLINNQPTIEKEMLKEHLNNLFGSKNYIDTDSVRIESKDV